MTGGMVRADGVTAGRRVRACSASAAQDGRAPMARGAGRWQHGTLVAAARVATLRCRSLSASTRRRFSGLRSRCATQREW
jgi:hypothetical protein